MPTTLAAAGNANPVLEPFVPHYGLAGMLNDRIVLYAFKAQMSSLSNSIKNTHTYMHIVKRVSKPLITAIFQGPFQTGIIHDILKTPTQQQSVPENDLNILATM